MNQFLRLTSTAALAALLGLTGACAGDSDEPTDDGAGGDDVGNPDDDLGGDPTTFLLAGTYEVDSTFDLASGVPGRAGEALALIIDLTDDPYDPATWLLDRIDNDTLNQYRSALEPLLFELIQQQAPDLVQDLLALGNKMGDLTREFGTISELEIREAGSGYEASHQLTGFAFEIDGSPYVVTVAELGASSPAAESVALAYDDRGILTVGDHAVRVPYGGFLALAVDQIVVPALDPFADDLEDLLARAVDCADVGFEIAYELGFGSPSTYEALCETGVTAGAAYLMGELRGIDENAPVTLNVAGTAVAVDRDRDTRVDELTRGTWQGAVDYAGTSAELAQDDGAFRAKRLR